MYFFDEVSMIGKLTEFQRAYFDMFLKNKNIVVVLISLCDKILIYQKSKLFGRLFNVILFQCTFSSEFLP